jgi:hypothetical protein
VLRTCAGWLDRAGTGPGQVPAKQQEATGGTRSPRSRRVRGRAAPEPGPGWQYNLSGNPSIEIAIYPEIVRLAAHNLRAQEPGAAVMMVKHVRAVMGAAASAALVNRAG